MKILYFTGMYPTKEAPHGGVFITKRIEAIRKTPHEYTLYAISVTDSKFVKKLRLIFSRNYRQLEVEKVICAPNSDVVYTVIDVELGLVDKLLNKLTGYKHQVNKTFRTIIKKIGKKDCDIIHAHWLYPTGSAIHKYAEYCKKPCVITSHGSDVNLLMKDATMQNHILETLNKADLIEFVSKALQLKAKSYGYNANNSVVVPNGIDSVPNISNNKKDNIIVGYVGNLIHIKRADKLADIIINIMEKTNKTIEFYIIGDGELKANLEERLNFNNVRFFGRIDHEHVLKKMQEMTVLMLPSRNEGWPCVVLEAHSCGLPVVGSSNGGIPEAINDNRLIVGEEDFEYHFAKKVLQVINNEITIDQGALIERAKQYKWDTLMIRTLENYNKLIRQEEI